jgi:hypothetical protein
LQLACAPDSRVTRRRADIQACATGNARGPKDGKTKENDLEHCQRFREVMLLVPYEYELLMPQLNDATAVLQRKAITATIYTSGREGVH